MLTGGSVTGAKDFCKQSVIERYSSRQIAVKIETVGPVITASKISADHIFELRGTLRYLGLQ
jgi:hypothetical protein